MTDKLSKADIEKELSAYKGNPLFADLANILRIEGDLQGGLKVCLEGLSTNPNCHLGRLALARIYHDLGYVPFCIRELKELYALLPKNQGIKKLLDLSAVDWDVSKVVENIKDSEKLLAEADFDMDVLGELEKEKNK